MHQLCWPTGQRFGDLEKIKLAAIDPLRVTTAEIRGLHTGAPSIWCCATQQTQQPPWKHCACRTCSTSLRLHYTEVYLVAPFKLQKQLMHLRTQVMVPDPQKDLDIGTVGVKSPKFSVFRCLA